MVNCRNSCCHRTCCQNIQDFELNEYEFQTLVENNPDFHNNSSPSESAFFLKYLIMRKNNLLWLFLFMSFEFALYIYNFTSFDKSAAEMGLTPESYENILNHLVYEMILFSIQMVLVFVGIVLYPFYKYSNYIVFSILLVKFIDIFSPLFYNYQTLFSYEPLYDDDVSVQRKNVYEFAAGVSLMFEFIGDFILSMMFLIPALISICYHIIINFKNNLNTSKLNYLLIPLETILISFFIFSYGIIYQLNFLEKYTISLISLTLLHHIFNILTIEGIIFESIPNFVKKTLYILKTVIFVAFPFVLFGFLNTFGLGFDIIDVIQNYYFGTTIYYQLIISSLINDFMIKTIQKNSIIHSETNNMTDDTFI